MIVRNSAQVAWTSFAEHRYACLTSDADALLRSMASQWQLNDPAPAVVQNRAVRRNRFLRP